MERRDFPVNAPTSCGADVLRHVGTPKESVRLSDCAKVAASLPDDPPSNATSHNPSSRLRQATKCDSQTTGNCRSNRFWLFHDLTPRVVPVGIGVIGQRGLPIADQLEVRRRDYAMTSRDVLHGLSVGP